MTRTPAKQASIWGKVWQIEPLQRFNQQQGLPDRQILYFTLNQCMCML